MPSPINHNIQIVSPIPPLPRPPSPSADIGAASSQVRTQPKFKTPPLLGDIDIFVLSPVAALELLCRSIDNLMELNADIPPTPPSKLLISPQLSGLGPGKENIALQIQEENCCRSVQDRSEIDRSDVAVEKPAEGPGAPKSELLYTNGSTMEQSHEQPYAVARKFYSRKAPPIGIKEYLLRMHKFCPTSTAVYLSTSLYIHRLATVDKIIPVNPRNVHRLVLAGLRVTMKALEDLSYPHRRFAKVGGVTELELRRLEISFCFITNFDFMVSSAMLSRHAKSIRDDTTSREGYVEDATQGYLPKVECPIIVDEEIPPAPIVPESPAAA